MRGATSCERLGHPTASVTYSQGGLMPLERSRCRCGQIWFRLPTGSVSLAELVSGLGMVVVVVRTVAWWGWLVGWAGPLGYLAVGLVVPAVVEVTVGGWFGRRLHHLFVQRGPVDG